MTSQHFYTIKIKRNFFPICFLLFTLCLLIFSKTNLPAVKQGLSLWANSVVPSMFPFFVATELLLHTNVVNHLGRIFNNCMQYLFNIRRRRWFCIYYGNY